jgi:prepilin-type N-terminal cleavage/methylation domain-containing protein/prepilin-type processing-associated H-X9-DG protein
MTRCKYQRTTRRGFSLVEMLVAVAVIAILIGLLLPAIQQVREAANRSACANNLHQIALAVSSYELDRGMLPPSRNLYSYVGEGPELLAPNDDEPDGDETIVGTWAVYILPNLEQQDLYNLWDFQPWYVPQPTKAVSTSYATTFDLQLPRAVQTPVKAYFCPSRRTMHTLPTLSVLDWGYVPGLGDSTQIPPDGQPGALGDYAANIGTTGDDIWNQILSPKTGPNGPFRLGWNFQGVPLVQITDGLSNTILLGEKQVYINGFGQLQYYDSSIYNGDNYWSSTRSGGTNYPISASIYNNNPFTDWAFGSYHSGVTQFAFVDGSVHAISSSISPQILQLLCCINDGEPIPPY